MPSILDLLNITKKIFMQTNLSQYSVEAQIIVFSLKLFIIAGFNFFFKYIITNFNQ